jgi:hypothetical protein
MEPEELKKEIEKYLQKYKVRKIKIKGKDYLIHIFNEMPRGNLYEGFLFVETNNKSKINALIKSDPYKEGRAYCERIIIILQKDKIIIRDTLFDRYITKAIDEIDETFTDKLIKTLSQPTEENFKKLFEEVK